MVTRSVPDLRSSPDAGRDPPPYVSPVATFLVDRVMPGLTTELLAEAQRLLHEAARRVSDSLASAEGVRYVRCTFVAEEQRCLCLFEAPSAEVVRRVNDIAQVPFLRIQPASEYSAPGTDTGSNRGPAPERSRT